jgi:uncharacterized protein (TIRG00374 family)
LLIERPLVGSESDTAIINPQSAISQHRGRQLLAGALLGGLALWLAFRGADWSEVRRSLAAVDIRIALLGTVCTLLSLAVNTFRWRRLFPHAPRDLGPLAFFRALTIGQAINILLPLRAGDVARLYALSSRGSVSAVQVLPTLVAEKVFDLTLFVVAIAWLALTLAWPAASPLQIAVRGAVAGGAMVLLLVTARVDKGLRFLDPLLARLGEGVRRRLRTAAAQVVEGLQVLRDPRAARDIALASAAIVALSALTNAAALRACGLTLPLTAPLLLVVSFQAGSMPPSLPGRIGVLHFATAASLAPFGVGKEDALTAALVLYVVAIVPRLVLGLAMLGGLRTRQALA